MNNSTPIFIAGAGRSGTTLVADMLGMHPHLSPIYETDFVLQVMRALFIKPALPDDVMLSRINHIMDEWTRTLPHPPHHKREHERFYHGPHYILFDRPFAMAQTEQLLAEIRKGEAPDGLRTFLNNLFQEHCRRDGKRRWLNKTPAYVRQMPLFHNLFPDLRFIHCIRDGRDVACSVLTRPWGPNTIPEAANWWMTSVISGAQFNQAHPTQCLELRYEDLLRDPTAQLSRMLSWLGEDDCSVEIVERYQQSVGSLNESRIGEWKQRLTPAELHVFQEQVGQLLAHFNYT